MKTISTFLKKIFSTILLLSFFSFTYAATTQEWRNIINELRKQWWTDDEIKLVIENLWFKANEYFSTTSTQQSNTITQEWQNMINQLKQQWRTEEEIKSIMKDLWIDQSQYFISNTTSVTSSDGELYTSRSCKSYNIEYINSLWVYSSPDLKRKEYFINTDYFKRYIDSKNPQVNGCPTNEWRIDVFFNDTSNSSERYTAPNWKTYFIIQQNGKYTSNELASSKSFSNITDLKNHIRNNNSFIRMWTSSSNYISNVDRTISNMKNEILNI